MTEQSNQGEGRAPDQVAVRELVGWFAGSVTGMYLGLAFGHYLQASLILFTAGVCGWMAGGLAGVLVTNRLLRTPPVRTISSHVAMGLIFGFPIGSLIGAFVGFFTGLPELPVSVLGSIFGLFAGRLAAPLIARRLGGQNTTEMPRKN